ncbi:hypothetical protein HDU76_013466, partial [Blyttiomyces sp. JEL0837]
MSAPSASTSTAPAAAAGSGVQVERRPGEARIKRSNDDEDNETEESGCKRQRTSSSDDTIEIDDDEPPTASTSPETAGDRGAKRDKTRKRGQNKDRPKALTRDSVSVCHEFIQGTCTRETCKYPHDIEAFLTAKGEDVNTDYFKVCPLFEKFGKCKFGLRCRFAKSHTLAGEAREQMVDEALVAKMGKSGDLLNVVSKSELGKLRKLKDSELPAYQDTVKWLERNKELIAIRDTFERKVIKVLNEMSGNSKPTDGAQVNGEGGKDVATPPVEDPALLAAKRQRAEDSLPFEEVQKYKIRSAELEKFTETYRSNWPEKKNKVDFRNKLILAPLTTVGNLPFRRLCMDYGADITVGEMAVTQQMLAGSVSEWALMRRHPTEKVFGVQLSVTNPSAGAKVTEYLDRCFGDSNGIDFVDLN